MLGRLEMDVDECIEAYKELMTAVFEKKSLFAVGLRGQIRSRFSSKALEKAIKGVVEEHGVPLNEQFYVKPDNEDSQKCRV